MSMPLFSIIVPCCDVAPYITTAIESLQTQNCGDFECFLVVEDSRDDTPEICRRIAAADPRFKVCAQPRSGSPAAPRNTGIALAKGEYVLLLDGDDWLEPAALARVKDSIESGGRPDVVQGAANEIREEREGTFRFERRLFNYRAEDNGRIFAGKEALLYLSKLHVNPFPAAWLSICRLDFLRENALNFIPGLCFEDEEWTPRVIYSAPRLAVMDFAFYNYRKRENSITSAQNRISLLHHAEIVNSLLDFHASHSFSHELSRAWGRNLLSFFFCFFFFPKYADSHSKAERKAVLRSVLADPVPFKLLVRHASLPKRTAAFFVLSARRFLFPADLFFRFVYYPLCMRKECRI